MTVLYLDGYEVVLDKKTSIKVVFDNPYFTKSSTYTHNVTLPLSGCRQNQLVFRHIDRTDVSKRTQTLKAILISDDRVLLNGTAIVTEITDSSVKIQLLAGNSEFNFFTSGDRMYINEMNIGTGYFPPDSFLSGSDPDMFFGEYPQTSCVWFPIYNENAREIYNRLAANYTIVGGESKESFHHYDPVYYNWCVQPYLCTIITNIIDKIGYSLVENQIEDTIFKNLFICNATVTNFFAYTLPHWTVNEFFNELEKFLGVVIVVDEGKKTIRILFLHNFFESDDCIFLDNVLDEFNAKVDKEETITVTNGNVGYSLSSSVGNKYKKIDSEIIKKATSLEFNTYSELLKKYNEMSQYHRDRSILKAENRHYIDYNDGNNHNLKEINQFRDLINNPDKQELDVDLKFAPVAMCKGTVEVYKAGTIFEGNYLWSGTTAMPSMEGGVFKKRANLVLQDEIDGNGVEDKYKPEVIQLAFNDGTYRLILGPDGKSHVYPIPFVDYSDDVAGYRLPFPSWSLRFTDHMQAKCLGSEIYSKMKKINTTVEETKKIISNKIYDPKKLFIIHNKKYVCKKIEIEANLDGIVPLQQATMYELLE